ncbi:MAG: YbbR-like domain-containing protein [Bacteroidia bacterium]
MKNKLFQLIQRNLFSRKVLTFIACLIVATFFWVINALNRNYTRTISIPVKFINLPKNKVLASELPKSIQAEIKTTGAKLLFILFKERLREVVIDVGAQTRRKKGNLVAISTSLSVGSLSKLLNTEVELVKVKPDSIYFNYGKSYQKVVPVKPDLSVNFDPLFNYTDKVKITPSFITVSGDSALLGLIDSISTERIVLNKLNQNISQTALLVVPEEYASRVALSADAVTLNINVDKFTESSLEVPVQVLNLPKEYQVKTFPDKVTVKFQVSMGEYERIVSSDFKIVVNYKSISPLRNKLPVEAVSYPPGIKITKIYPEKVEYIVRKQ